MPKPRTCETCKHWRPYEGSERLRETYAKCAYPNKASTIQYLDRKFVMPEFAQTCRGAQDLCGSTGAWWEEKAIFEIVEDEPQGLRWPEDDDDDED